MGANLIVKVEYWNIDQNKDPIPVAEVVPRGCGIKSLHWGFRRTGGSPFGGPNPPSFLPEGMGSRIALAVSFWFLFCCFLSLVYII